MIILAVKKKNLGIKLLHDPQMILLYRDPHRQNSGATSQTDQSGFSSQMRTSKRVELEKKVTQLEKTVQEKEKTISELRTRIEVTQLSAVINYASSRSNHGM